MPRCVYGRVSAVFIFLIASSFFSADLFCDEPDWRAKYENYKKDYVRQFGGMPRRGSRIKLKYVSGRTVDAEFVTALDDKVVAITRATGITINVNRKELSADTRILIWVDDFAGYHAKQKVLAEKGSLDQQNHAARIAAGAQAAAAQKRQEAELRNFRLTDPDAATFTFDRLDPTWIKPSGDFLWVTQTTFTVKNLGQEPLKYLRIKFALYEDSKVFDEYDRYIISGDDLPLPSGITSRIYTATGNVGYNLSVYRQIGESRYQRAVNSLSENSYRCVVYAKTSIGGNWEQFGEFLWKSD